MPFGPSLVLWTRPHFPGPPRPSHHPQRKLRPHRQPLPAPPSPSPWRECFVFRSLLLPGISCTQNRTVCVPARLVYLTWHNVSKARPTGDGVAPRWLGVPPSLYLLIGCGRLPCFRLLASGRCATGNVGTPLCSTVFPAGGDIELCSI